MVRTCGFNHERIPLYAPTRVRNRKGEADRGIFGATGTVRRRRLSSKSVHSKAGEILDRPRPRTVQNNISEQCRSKDKMLLNQRSKTIVVAPPKVARPRPTSGKVCPFPSQSWPFWANFGPTSVTIGPRVGRPRLVRAKFGRFRATVGRGRPSSGRTSGRCWPMQGEVWPKLAEICGPTRVNVQQSRAEFGPQTGRHQLSKAESGPKHGQHRPALGRSKAKFDDIGRCALDLAESGPKSTAFGQASSKAGRPRP